jgi:hypothetical protein
MYRIKYLSTFSETHKRIAVLIRDAIDNVLKKQWRSKEGVITISCCCWLDMIPNTIWYEKTNVTRENWNKKVTWLKHSRRILDVDEFPDILIVQHTGNCFSLHKSNLLHTRHCYGKAFYLMRPVILLFVSFQNPDIEIKR